MASFITFDALVAGLTSCCDVDSDGGIDESTTLEECGLDSVQMYEVVEFLAGHGAAIDDDALLAVVTFGDLYRVYLGARVENDFTP